jgi:hypothetical protein
LSDEFYLANVLNDISNFETGQISVENNSQIVAVTNTPTLNTFRISGIQSTSELIIISINNYTVSFKSRTFDACKCRSNSWKLFTVM